MKTLIDDVYQSLCCAGFGWEVLSIIPDDNPKYNSIWGRCANPDCPKKCGCNPPTKCHWDGVSNFCQEDMNEMLEAREGDDESD